MSTESIDSFYVPQSSQYLNNVFLESISIWSPSPTQYSWYITLNFVKPVNGIVCIRVNITDNASTATPKLYGTMAQRSFLRLTTTTFRPTNEMKSTVHAVNVFQAPFALGTTFGHVLHVMRAEMPGYQLPIISAGSIHGWVYKVFQTLATADLIHTSFDANLNDIVTTLCDGSQTVRSNIRKWPPPFGQIIKQWV